MAITNPERIIEILDQYSINIDGETPPLVLYVYETLSRNNLHYKKDYLTSKDIDYYSNQYPEKRIAVFTEDPEIIDSDDVYSEIME